VKDAVAGQTADVAGELLLYTITVANTGNVTLTGVTVTDPNANAGSIVRGTDAKGDNDALLEFGETWAYTAAHTLTLAEIDSNGGGDGFINNIATAHSAQTPDDTDDAKIPVEYHRALHIEKDATVPGGTADFCGEVISYTMAVTHAAGSNAPIANVMLTDELTFDEAPVLVTFNNQRYNTGDTDHDNLLDVSETWLYTASHTVTQDEMDAGTPIVNVAVVDGTGATSDDDDATVQILGTPKFYTVDPGTDRIYGYTAGGGLIATNSQLAGNTDAYGITGNAAGTKLWVLDLNKTVYVYNTSGTALGMWTAGGLGATPEGIALDIRFGQDFWIVDSTTDKVYWYDNAGATLSGTVSSGANFPLTATNDKAKGITTDGTTLWVVEDDTANTVFLYTIVRDGQGTPTGLTTAGSWTLNSANTTPTGITLDPTGASQSLWVVDSGTDTVYEYANARILTSGSGLLASTFLLTAANTNAQDIFDPNISSSGQVDDAIVPLDGQLEALGMQPAEVPAAGDQGADIRIHLASSGARGGWAQGVLGSAFANGISINGDWNHYAAADANSARAGQIDFQSANAHESGPVLGLGHNSDLASALSPYLAAGQAGRDPSASDLSGLDWVFLDRQRHDSGLEALLAQGRQPDARVVADGDDRSGGLRTGGRHLAGMTRDSALRTPHTSDDADKRRVKGFQDLAMTGVFSEWNLDTDARSSHRDTGVRSMRK